jgi:hypothetical protein
MAFGVAWVLWQSFPKVLQQRFGMALSLMTLAALFALLHVAVRYPFFSTTGQGAGHFVLDLGNRASHHQAWAMVVTIVTLMPLCWATPDGYKTMVWTAGVCLAIAACLCAVFWRMRQNPRRASAA